MNFDIDNRFLEIIEQKHKELNLGKDYSKKFSKIKDFEANAIGQIGETFVKELVSNYTEIIVDDVIHNEYDVKTKNNIYFEVKTARKGRTNNTFQFNGINPNYNYDYLICLGVCEDVLLYRMFLKNEIHYVHKNRKHVITQGNFERKLVQMNPNNLVNFKLTISIKDLHPISELPKQLSVIFQ